ncbi:MAG: hypothetical protein ACYDH1_00100 [Anaerolineaceae bacterium]
MRRLVLVLITRKYSCFGKALFILVRVTWGCNLTPPVSTPPANTKIPPTLSILISNQNSSPSPTPIAAKSTDVFQVFILNPVITCIAGNDFYNGEVCYGANCGDCNCNWDEFDPHAPFTGISPSKTDTSLYLNFEQRLCFEITLNGNEIDAITQDMEKIRDLVLEWTEASLDL